MIARCFRGKAPRANTPAPLLAASCAQPSDEQPRSSAREQQQQQLVEAILQSGLPGLVTAISAADEDRVLFANAQSKIFHTEAASVLSNLFCLSPDGPAMREEMLHACRAGQTWRRVLPVLSPSTPTELAPDASGARSEGWPSLPMFSGLSHDGKGLVGDAGVTALQQDPAHERRQGPDGPQGQMLAPACGGTTAAEADGSGLRCVGGGRGSVESAADTLLPLLDGAFTAAAAHAASALLLSPDTAAGQHAPRGRGVSALSPTLTWPAEHSSRGAALQQSPPCPVRPARPMSEQEGSASKVRYRLPSLDLRLDLSASGDLAFGGHSPGGTGPRPLSAASRRTLTIVHFASRDLGTATNRSSSGIIAPGPSPSPGAQRSRPVSSTLPLVHAHQSAPSEGGPASSPWALPPRCSLSGACFQSASAAGKVGGSSAADVLFVHHPLPTAGPSWTSEGKSEASAGALPALPRSPTAAPRVGAAPAWPPVAPAGPDQELSGHLRHSGAGGHATSMPAPCTTAHQAVLASPPQRPSSPAGVAVASGGSAFDESLPQGSALGSLGGIWRHAHNGTGGHGAWHEVVAKPFVDPRDGRAAILITQTDVSERVAAELVITRLLEGHLSMLSTLFPRHVIEFFSSRDASPAMMGQLARAHENVTLLFMDVVGFTAMARQVEPAAVMTLLNQLFTTLDLLCDKHGIQKVETAGDAYVAASGILCADEEGFQSTTASHDAAESAARMLAFAKGMLAMARTVRMPHNGQPVQIRIGMHTGSCVTGLVGVKLPKFSVFGDAINTASRMESTGQPGCIQVSEPTWRLLRGRDRWRATGGVEVKGKGQMQTYMWEGETEGESSSPV